MADNGSDLNFISGDIALTNNKLLKWDNHTKYVQTGNGMIL